jgi:hypothetical protein
MRIKGNANIIYNARWLPDCITRNRSYLWSNCIEKMSVDENKGKGKAQQDLPMPRRGYLFVENE